jgi:hypothetical protein
VKILSAIFSAAALYCFSADVAWAVIGSCATNAMLVHYGTPSTADGCYVADQTFSNFSVTDNSGGLGTGFIHQTTSTIDIRSTNTFSTVLTPWVVSSILTGAVPADFSATGGNGGAASQGDLFMLVNTTNTYLTNPTYPQPTAGFTNVITSISAATSGSTGNGSPAITDFIVAEIIACIGTATCTKATEVVIESEYLNNTTTPTYTCFAGTSSRATCGSASSASPIVATFAQGVTTLNMDYRYSISSNQNASGGTTTTTLNNWTTTFGENEQVPEPSTFLFFGSALAVLAWKYRVKLMAKR